MSRRVELKVPPGWYAKVEGYARNQTRTIQNMLIHAMDQHMRRYPQSPKTGPRAHRGSKTGDSIAWGVEVEGSSLPVPARGLHGEEGETNA